MADKTTNYNLTKPLDNEYYDIGISNGNMDIIDEQLKERDTRVGPLASLISRIKTSIVNAINGLQTDFNEHKAEYASEIANRVKKDGDTLNGVYKIGNSYQNILFYSGNSRKIVTNITFSVSFMYTIILEGRKHDAGTSDFRPLYLMLTLIPYTTSAYYSGISSINTYKPEVKFGQENGKLVIFINDSHSKTFNIRCISTNQNIDAFKNWNVVNEEIVGTAYTVPYI